MDAHTAKVLAAEAALRKMSEREYRALVHLRRTATAYLEQDARYDDLTDECAAAKRALARAAQAAR